MSNLKGLVWLIGIFLCMHMHAATWEDASSAFDRDDFPAAFEKLLPLAESGDLRAQTLLGSMYQHGLGVKTDYAQAVSWYKKAADQKFALAQYSLGVLYEGGIGVSADYARAFALYQSSAEQGLAVAQESLAYMYYFGKGISVNKETAVMWAEKAARQGSSEAHKMLARFIAWGNSGKESDMRMAYHYAQAADLGDSHSRYLLGSMYIDGQGVAQNKIIGAALFKACLLDVGQSDKNKAFLLEELSYLQLSESEDKAAEELGRKVAVSKNLLSEIDLYLNLGLSE